MKIGVLTNAFCERELIGGCIDQFAGQFPHVVLVSNTPWNGEWKHDDTHVIAAHHGANVSVGNWGSAQEQLNYGLSLLSDMDWVLIVDADERYSERGIEELINSCREYRYASVGALRTNQWSVYWKTPDYKIIPEQTDYPLIAIKPIERFGWIRSYEGKIGWSAAHMHHFSYVRSDEAMLKKVQSFDASREFEVGLWYQNVWLKWTPEMECLHPVVPCQFRKAVWSPCPDDVRRYV